MGAGKNLGHLTRRCPCTGDMGVALQNWGKRVPA